MFSTEHNLLSTICNMSYIYTNVYVYRYIDDVFLYVFLYPATCQCPSFLKNNLSAYLCCVVSCPCPAFVSISVLLSLRDTMFKAFNDAQD